MWFENVTVQIVEKVEELGGDLESNKYNSDTLVIQKYLYIIKSLNEECLFLGAKVIMEKKLIWGFVIPEVKW